MNKSKIEKRQPEPLHGTEQKADGLPSSPAIANTHVQATPAVGSFYLKISPDNKLHFCYSSKIAKNAKE